MGAFRRRIAITTKPLAKGGIVRGAMEDDFHHFRLEIEHQQGLIKRIQAQALRIPTSLCPSALDQLHTLEGMTLDASSVAPHSLTSIRQQCTHIFDLAGVACANAFRGKTAVRYEVEVTDAINSKAVASILKDDKPLLIWTVNRMTIESPGPFAGRKLGSGFTAWASQNLTATEAEAAFILRRCVYIAPGRKIDLDDPNRISTTSKNGACWVSQPHQQQQAERMKGSTWDFSKRGDQLLESDGDWLNF